jgi:hypothetical protein
VEYHKAELRQVAGRGASGDDAARFLNELRQLRDGAGLGHAELAARAHFPYDSIRAAEVGPSLPDLPVLSAYVRGCGGTTEEWEERWRSLTRSPSLPVSASRNAGRSDAATAGARIGSASAAGDNPDPSIILAALDRVAEEMASPGAVPAAAPPDVESAADLTRAEAAREAPADPAPASKPNGWDPIRVSTAWPVIRDTPPVATEPADDNGPAEPSVGPGPSRPSRGTMPPQSAAFPGSTAPAAGTLPPASPVTSGAGAPWDTAPWAVRPSTAGSPVTSAADPAAGGPTAGTARAPRPAAGDAAGAGTEAGRPASWTRVAVIAAVLVCVLAVLLAVFA